MPGPRGFRRTLGLGLLAAALAGAAFPESRGRSDHPEVIVRSSGVSVHAKAVPLNELLSELCRQAGMEFRGEIVTVPVDADFDDLPLDIALLRLLGGVNYSLTWTPLPDDPSAAPGRRYRPAEIWIGRRQAGEPPPESAGPEEAGPSLDACLDDLARPDSERRFMKSARALAAMGTPEAARPLFDALRAMPEGEQRNDLVHIAGSITNPAAAAALVDIWLDADANEPAERAASESLARVIDADALRELRAACERNAEPSLDSRFVDLVRRIGSPSAESAVAEWTGAEGRAPATDLEEAAWTALSRIGTGSAADRLIERADTVPTEDAGFLYGTVHGMAPTPQALASLRYAAVGNKLTSREETRLAALEALSRFPDGESLALMQRLAGDPSAAVRRAAGRILKTWGAPAP